MKYFVKCKVSKGMFRREKAISLISADKEKVWGFISERKTKGNAVEVTIHGERKKNQVLVEFFHAKDIYPGRRVWVKKNQLITVGKRKK